MLGTIFVFIYISLSVGVWWRVGNTKLYSLLVYIEHDVDESPKDHLEKLIAAFRKFANAPKNAPVRMLKFYCSLS